MKVDEGIHYHLKRRRSSQWWQEPKYHGDIEKIECAFCDFEIRKKSVRKPRSSKSGLGRYNRMKGIIVKHLHDEHRDQIIKATEENDRHWQQAIEKAKEVNGE